ncbi:MAG: hypothetical protein O9295_20210 [Microcystis sp. LE18-22.4A]|nr:hypothetical protein [Microcystis sp. LE18-22.4A]
MFRLMIGFRSQETVFRRLFLFILPTPHTPHPTPHTPCKQDLV